MLMCFQFYGVFLTGRNADGEGSRSWEQAGGGGMGGLRGKKV